MLKNILRAFFIFNLLAATPIYAGYSKNICVQNIDKHVNIDTLDLSKCQLQDQDISAVYEYITQRRWLHNILLNDNNIGPDGVYYFTSLRQGIKINFDNNHLGDRGVAILASKIDNVIIGSISLKNNQLTDKAAEVLAKVSLPNTLDLSDNKITIRWIKLVFFH